MRTAKNGFNMRGVIATTAGGAALMFVGAQLMAKPQVQAVGKAGRGGGSAARETTRPVTPPPPGILPSRTRAAAEPEVRELFRPLVAPKSGKGGTAPLPGGTAPALPDPTKVAKASEAVKSAAPAPSSEPSTPAPDPSRPSASSLQMLGVVEMDGKPQVLLKNTVSNQSRYAGKGEQVFGFTVNTIEATRVALERDGRTETVVMPQVVNIEGPGASTTTVGSGFGSSFNRGSLGSNGFSRNGFGGSSSFGGGGGSGYSGYSGRDRSDRSSYSRDRSSDSSGRDRGDRGSSSSGGSSTSDTIAQVFALSSWSDRLKKLDEIKAQIPADQYTRLKTFMEGKAKEQGGK